MKRSFRNLQWRALIILIGLLVTLASRADPLGAVQVLREVGWARITADCRDGH